ncbi:MAG: hypothetical protein ACP5M0_08710 [Desulfomonilaceae bacterium]
MQRERHKDQSSKAGAAKKPISKRSPNKTSGVKKPAKSAKRTRRIVGDLVPEPPDGFLVLGPSQVMMEFAQPLLEMAPYPTGDTKKMNEIFGVVPEIWNYTLEPPSKKKEADLISLVSRRLKLDEKQSRDFLNMMVERRLLLFPLDIQPEETPYVFMRKQVCYLINQFDYESLDLVPEVLGPDALDNTWVAGLRTFLYEKEYLPAPPYLMFEFLDSLNPLYVEFLTEAYS